MNRLRRAAWIGGLILLVLAGGIAVHAAPRMKARDATAGAIRMPEESSAMAVATVHPILTEWQDAIQTAGAIAPWQEAFINAEIGGYRLIELRADVGDIVEKGQVLALLNPAMLQAQRAELQARLDRAVADRKRAATLSAKGNLSEKSLLEAETEEKMARALLEQKLLEIRQTSVVAPDAGIVVSRAAMLGQVSPLGTELFRIIRQGRLEWRAEIAASDLSKIAVGQNVDIDLPEGETAFGIVRQISPSLDETTRRGLIYADLIQGSGARAGMYRRGRLLLGARQGLVIPAASLLVKDGRHYVARVSESEGGALVALAPVTIGGYSGDRAEITSGLSPMDMIVREGAGLLDDGDRVRVVQAGPAE